MNTEKIGKYIAQCRKKVNLTQEELAELMGVTAKSVSKWECGICLPSIDKIQDLCYFLKTNLFNLLNGEDSEYKFYIEKVGGTKIKPEHRKKNYQVKYTNLEKEKMESLKNIKPDNKKHIIRVRIEGFDINEKDGITYGNFYAKDSDIKIILTLNDNGEYESRKIINNINIGSEYLCKGFVLDADFFDYKKAMIVEEIREYK